MITVNYYDIVHISYSLRLYMSDEIRNEALLSKLIDLFDHLKVEDFPNQPIANADDHLNEPLIRQIADEIQQKIATLSDIPIQVFENDAQLIHLITSSGGHKKTQHILLHATFLYSQEFPVSQRAIGRARGDLKYAMNNSVDADKWHLLASVHHEPCGNYSELSEYKELPLWSILRYEDKGVVWYRIHPLLTETVGFRRAIEVVVE